MLACKFIFSCTRIFFVRLVSLGVVCVCAVFMHLACCHDVFFSACMSWNVCVQGHPDSVCMCPIVRACAEDSPMLSKFGGTKPLLYGDHQWPRCGMCNRNMMFVMQIDERSLDSEVPCVSLAPFLFLLLFGEDLW